MLVLGIESSCDETAAAIVADGSTLLASIVDTQIAVHSRYGGVVPELASRRHLETILPVVHAALQQANIGFGQLDGLAVTRGPGLIGSLLVGFSFTKALAMVTGLPYVGVDHMAGHLLSVFLSDTKPEYPYIALVASGGHSSIFQVTDPLTYRLLGRTRDDAAGEAFDKVAKILGFGYPGGAIIESMSRSGRADSIAFPRAYLSDESFDFSFSGLKTAVSLYIDKWEKQGDGNPDNIRVEDITASFQEAVFEVLVNRLIRAGKSKDVSSIVLAGGVACNGTLREKLSLQAEKAGMKVFYPRPEFCTDNGAMIALAGYYRALNNEYSDMSIDVRSRYPVKDI